MIYNEDTYCTVWHKIVREIGAWEAVVYGTIVNLLRKTNGYGNVSNQTLIELIGKDKKSIYRWIDNLVKAGYLEKVGGKGRGNISIYYITKKGGEMTPFKEEKRGQIDTEKGANNTIKGGNMPPINKDINKEINKESSSFDSELQKPKMEEEDKKLFEENINNSEISSEDEQQAIEDVKNLFAQDEIGNETKSSFAEFWKLFNPDENQKCKYKVALQEWNSMPENWRAAAIELLQKGARPSERNPYFFLQHFSPVKYFLNEREQYQAWKDRMQLCSVRWNGKQKVMAAFFAQAFRMEIVDDHYEKRFEI